MNVAEPGHATELFPVLRAIAGADIRNLVLQVGGDWRIVPTLRPAVSGSRREALDPGSIPITEHVSGASALDCGLQLTVEAEALGYTASGSPSRGCTARRRSWSSPSPATLLTG